MLSDKEINSKIKILNNQTNVIKGLVKRLKSEWFYTKRTLEIDSRDIDRALNILENELMFLPERETSRLKQLYPSQGNGKRR